MGQFMGVLALLLSETPLLQLNVTRYISALKLAIGNLKPINSTVLGIQNNCSYNQIKNRKSISDLLQNAIDDFSTTAQDFVARSKSIDTEKYVR